MRDEWWYAIHGVKQGPVKFEDLKQRLLDDTLSPDDLVWTAGMSQWTAVHDVPVLLALLQPPELPPPVLIDVPPELPEPKKTSRPERQGSFLVTEPQPIETPAAMPELAGPWRRYFARWLDLAIIGWPSIFILAVVFPAFAQSVQKPNGELIFGIVSLPTILFIEAVIFGFFGTTPGKALLGIEVTSLNYKKIQIDHYIYRQIGVWFFGLGVGIFPVAIFTMAKQYSRLKSCRATGYDEGSYLVIAKKIGIIRYVVAGLLFVVLIVSSAILGLATRGQGA